MIPSIWTGMYHEVSLAEAITILGASGWRGFECSTEHMVMICEHADARGEVAKARQALADIGAVMPQAHALISANVAHPDSTRRKSDLATLHSHIDLAAELGVETVVVHPGDGGGYATRGQYRETLALNVAAFSELADHAGRLGLRVGIENMHDGAMGRSVRRFGSMPAELLEVVEEAGMENLGFILDTDHIVRQRLDVGYIVSEFGARLFGTHISDADGGSVSHRTPGAGKLDWSSVVAALTDVGYDGLFNLEIPGDRHPDPAMLALKVKHAFETVQMLLDARR